MEHKQIVNVLICLLVLSCITVTAVALALRKEIFYLPDKSVDDLVSILEGSGIYIDKSIISTKKERGIVYVCGSGDYGSDVAKLIGRENIKYSFTTPDGEIIIMSDGARFEFGDSFSFKYYKDGNAAASPDPFELSQMTGHPTDNKIDEISKIVSEFLERGSDDFESRESLSIVTEVERVWENSGKYYAFCTRSIDGVAINDNRVMCTIEGGEVTEAYGTWCFLTLGESYSAQLSDILNILFNVKKELGVREDIVTIESIGRCYSLYTYGEDKDFCLIPCWQIVTDNAGEYIYNAIDSTLYTKN